MAYKRDLANPLAPTYGDENKPKKKKEYVYKSDYDKKIEEETKKYGTLVKSKDKYSYVSRRAYKKRGKSTKNIQKRKYKSDDYVTTVKEKEGRTGAPTIKRRKRIKKQ